MTPGQTLIHEHIYILQALDVIDGAIKKMKSGTDVPNEFWSKILEFLRGFADKCHHAKEENYFLPLIQEKGTKKYQAYAKVVISEHELARAYLAEAENAVNAFYGKNKKDALRTLFGNFSDYSEMLRNHILKENIYFINCENNFLQDNLKELEQAFEKVEKKEIGEGVHERYLGLLKKLEQFK